MASSKSCSLVGLLWNAAKFSLVWGFFFCWFCWFFFPPYFNFKRKRLSLGIAVNSIWSCDQGWLHLNKAIMVACRVPVSFQHWKWGWRCGSDTYKKPVKEKVKIKSSYSHSRLSHGWISQVFVQRKTFPSMLSPCLRGLSHSSERMAVCSVMQRASAHN